MRRLPATLAALGLSLASSCPRAEVPAQASACAEQSACSAVACELARALGERTTDPLVVTAALPSSDRSLRDAEGLSTLLARLVAGRLGDAARASAPAPLALARGAARDIGKLVHLTPVVRDGVLEVTADLHDVRQGFWDRVRTAPREPVAHAFARRRIDVEVASFLERPPLVALEEQSFRGPNEVMALACGDANQDGALELVAVTRGRIQVGRLRSGAFQELDDVRWSALSPVAPVPLREPLGAAWIDHRGITVGLSDRLSAVVLSPSLEPAETLRGQVPLGPDLCLSVRAVVLAEPQPCREAAGGGAATAAMEVDALAWRPHMDASGNASQLLAWRDAATRALELRVSGDPSREATLAGVGAQIALADLDLDGSPEVLTSLPSPAGEPDALRVYTWTPSGALELRLEHPVPDGIDAIAACPPERGRLSRVVVATGHRLLVLG